MRWAISLTGGQRLSPYKPLFGPTVMLKRLKDVVRVSLSGHRAATRGSAMIHFLCLKVKLKVLAKHLF